MSFRTAVQLARKCRWNAAVRELVAPGSQSDYAVWRALHTPSEREARRLLDGLAHRPLISLVVPRAGLAAESAARQIYAEREVVVGNGQAGGEFVAFLDADDELAPHALIRVAQAIETGADVIYGDDDTRHDHPFFKPDFSPEYLLAWNYIRLAFVRKSALKKFPEARGHDLLLRLHARGARFHHIPDVLCHRADVSEDPLDSRKAVQAFLDSTAAGARVEVGLAPELHRVRYPIPAGTTVSIVIPSACRPVTLGGRQTWFLLECVSSIRRVSTYPNLEIIVLDNNDMSAELSAAIQPFGVRVIPFTEPFNLARKMNQGALAAAGQHLVLLNDDVEIVSPDWIESMLEFSARPDIGAVGCTLLFPDQTQQHTGVVILDGNPRHPFYGKPADHPGYFHSSQVHRNWSAVTGACMMTRAEVFKSVGGFSENFPLNYNDVDYCLKVCRQNKRIVCTPHARIIHHESVSKSGTHREEYEEFRRVWGEKFPRDPFYNLNLGRHFRIRR